MTRPINPHLVKLCNLLSDLDYHDGTSLGLTLGITRTAVWKLVKKLQQYHIAMKTSKTLGYALEAPLILLDNSTITSKLSDTTWHMDVIESVASTNDFLNQHTHDRHICLTEHQATGRGRLGRIWHSPFAQNIYMSLSYSFAKDISALGGLSLAVALMTCRAIESTYDLPQAISVKWPNDLYYADKKLGGILIDLQAETHGHCRVVIGIGINVNMDIDTSKETDIDTPWISLKQITGELSDRNPLVTKLINQLSEGLARYQTDGFAAFVDDWQTRDCLRHRTIQLQWAHQTVVGTVADVNTQGHLGVRLADGTIKYFSSGEASLRANYPAEITAKS